MVRKDAALKVRVEEDLRHAFVDFCGNEDRPTAQTIREFTRDYVQQKRGETQPGLSDENNRTGY